MTSAQKTQAIRAVLLGVAIVGYSLPWLVSTTASLQPGAYDLAEWVSLHPLVRTSSSLLLPALALRLPLVGLGLLCVLSIREEGVRWINWLLVVLVAGIGVALLPPVAFFQGGFRDPNYLQQALLLLVYLLTGLTLYTLSARHLAEVMIVVVVLLSAAWGVLRSYQLLSIYQIPLSVGPGGFIFLACVLLLMLTRVERRAGFASRS